MGTRLAATKESEVPETVKDVWINANEEDTVIDPAFDGINCRVLKNEAAEKLLQKRTLQIFDAISAGFYMKKELKLSFGDMIRTAISLPKSAYRHRQREKEFGLNYAFRCGRQVVQ